MATRAESAVSAVTASDIISRIERIPYSSWHVKLRVIVGLALFFEAVDNVSMGSVLPVLVGEWKIRPDQVGMLISFGYLGTALGALTCGWLAEKYGRMKILIFTVALFAVMSFVCSQAWSFGSLAVFRVIQGFGLGGEVPVAGAFINEWSKTQGRGRFYLMYNLLMTLGVWAGAVLGLIIVPSLGWRWMFIVGGSPAVLCFVLRWWIPESPRWLANKGRLDEADQIVRNIENKVSKNGTVPLPPVVPLPITVEPRKTRFAELFQGIYLKRTLVLWVMSFCASFSILAITAWLPTLYRTVYKLPLKTALTYGMLSMAATAVSNLILALAADRVGRRAWFIWMFIGGGVSYGLVGLLAPGGAPVFLVFQLFAALFVASLGGCMILWRAEVYPTRMRALGSSTSQIFSSVSAVISPLVIGYIVAGYGMFPVFLVISAVCFFAAIFLGIFVEETRNRPLEEIAP